MQDVYYFYPDKCYQSDYEKVRRQVKSSNLLITDGIHRIAGISVFKDMKHTAEVTYIGMRTEIPFAKQIAFQNGIKILTDSAFSLKLVRYYTVGETVFYSKEISCLYKKSSTPDVILEERTKLSDVILTDEKNCTVGLKYVRYEMMAPQITFLSEDAQAVKQKVLKFDIPEYIDDCLTKAIFKDHSPGEEIMESYYRPVVLIFCRLRKEGRWRY